MPLFSGIGGFLPTAEQAELFADALSLFAGAEARGRHAPCSGFRAGRAKREQVPIQRTAQSRSGVSGYGANRHGNKPPVSLSRAENAMMRLIVGCMAGFLERENLLKTQTACHNANLLRQAVCHPYAVLAARFSQPGKPE